MTSSDKIWTAGLVIIGDEILSGRTHDKNIAQVASWLQVQGIRLSEVRVVADIQSKIVETHDDITVDAVAEALGVDVIVHPTAREILERYYADKGGVNEGRLRMARVPDGADLIPNHKSGAPGIRHGNIFLMAGVPHITAGMLDALTGELEGGLPLIAESVGGFIPESEVATLLLEVEQAHENCQIGSYPFFREGKVGSNFVIRSTDADALKSCMDVLCEGLAENGWDFTPGGI